jgi:hypothetical protein
LVNPLTGTLQWDVCPLRSSSHLRDNHRQGGVYLNGKKVDGFNQYYPPHGSLRKSTWDSRFNDPLVAIKASVSIEPNDDFGGGYWQPRNACKWYSV